MKENEIRYLPFHEPMLLHDLYIPGKHVSEAQSVEK